MDSPGIPLDWLLLVIIGLPACVATFFGLLAFKDMTPLVFRCQRCSRDFTRRAWRRFPRSCPRCRARDWNAHQRTDLHGPRRHDEDGDAPNPKELRVFA